MSKVTLRLAGSAAAIVSWTLAGCSGQDSGESLEVNLTQSPLKTVEESEADLWSVDNYLQEIDFDTESGVRTQKLRVVGVTEPAEFGPHEKKVVEPIDSRTTKFAPELERRLAVLGPDSEIEVMVSIAHQSPFTRLTRLDRKEPRDSTRNQARMRTRAAEFAAVEVVRAATRLPIAKLVSALGGVVLEEHTMGNGLTLRIPAAALKRLESEPSVLGIALRASDEPPPAPRIVAGRTAINSDLWYNAGTDGFASYFHACLIDDGVLGAHTVFTSGGGGNLGLHRDCTHGNSYCANSPPNPDYNDQGLDEHGTASANIIMGGVSSWPGWGADFRGVSKVALDYINAYKRDEDGHIGLDRDSFLRAMNLAALWADDLIIAEVQSPTTEADLPALAADDAFDMGIAVVGAVGNLEFTSVAAAPGNAHKAMAIGAWHLESGSVAYQVSGSVGGRYKPDVQFPSYVDAAGHWTPYAPYANYGGTSAATAFAGGAAAILYDFFDGGGGSEPGLIYAALLARGTSSSGGHSTNGAGRFKFETGGTSWSGKITLGTSAVTVNIAVPTSRKNLRVAIWWPEAHTDAHNDVDLEVLTPSNGLLGNSLGGGTVWELVAGTSNLVAGTYKIKFKPYNMPRPSQTVYFSALAAPQ